MNAVDLRNMGLKGLAKEIMGKMENVRLSKWDNRHLTLLLNCILVLVVLLFLSNQNVTRVLNKRGAYQY